MPMDCARCGGVMDWGDFGPDPDDGEVGTTCTCEPLEPRVATGKTHVLLIPMDEIAPETAPRIKEALSAHLPEWIDPIIIAGGRGSATLINITDATITPNYVIEVESPLQPRWWRR